MKILTQEIFSALINYKVVHLSVMCFRLRHSLTANGVVVYMQWRVSALPL